MAGKSKTTPLMKQYASAKARHPDAILLFRVGDFYETFGDDAVEAASILDIVLTQRNNGGDQTPLAGFPHHALQTYLPKLVRAGKRVAICEQLEDPKLTKGIVKRGVTELVTPGVALADEILNQKKNNFLAAVYEGRRNWGLSLLDISTGEFLATEGERAWIEQCLQHYSPSEVLWNRSIRKKSEEWAGLPYIYYQDDWIYQEDYARESLLKHFRTHSLKGFGWNDLGSGLIAAGAILHYLGETQHTRLGHVNRLQPIKKDRYLWMDRFTIRNLELYGSLSEGGCSLREVIDRTRTAMGGRMLLRWIAQPLIDRETLEERLDLVQVLCEQPDSLNDIQEILKRIGDLERWLSKLSTHRISPRELVSLKNSLRLSMEIPPLLRGWKHPASDQMAEAWPDMGTYIDHIESVLDEDAASQIGKGPVIATGFHEGLDELRGLAHSGKDYLDQLLKRESERTGITSLKIASNNVFGYYIEVRNTHKDKVPEEWIRKQTLVNAERYITEELKEYEARILGAEEKSTQLETRLFEDLLRSLQPAIAPAQSLARLVARLDCLSGFAELGRERGYVRPEFCEDGEIDIRDGRHPVIEATLPPGEAYVPNDLKLNRDEQQILMITGPNMSGKSALLRQTALIALMAQMGSFVPAASARLSITDRLFTRVGASDNLSQGESTFMVEMNETASILNNLSDRSLILMDEIGRGTSTYDGISIAWAIAEYLHNHPMRPKTLFATHYHELNRMNEEFPRIHNFNVSVKENKDSVIFLRKLVRGGCEHSFGIHVAQLAGMPQTVLQRSRKLLKELEAPRDSYHIEESLQRVAEEDVQLSIFQLDDPLLDEIRSDLLQLDIDRLTPVEALMKLNEIKRLLEKNNKAIS